MVAIVSGDGLGLSTSSLSTLKAQGRIGQAQQGRGNDRVYLNIANGNLVIQSLDEHLAGPGLSTDSLRTYNSQGKLNGEYLDAPLQPTRLEVQGGLNSANSRITRIDDDGHASLYVWDASRNAWLNTDGDGAYDTIRYDKASATLTWTDGDSGVSETHQRVGDDWLLMSRQDADGESTVTEWDHHDRRVAQTDALGRTQKWSWDAQGKLAAYSDLSGIATRYNYDHAGQLVRQTSDRGQDVRREYDAAGRLVREVDAATPTTPPATASWSAPPTRATSCKTTTCCSTRKTACWK